MSNTEVLSTKPDLRGETWSSWYTFVLGSTFSRSSILLSSEEVVVRFPPSFTGVVGFLSRFCLPFFRFDASLGTEGQGNHIKVNPEDVAVGSRD